MAWRLPLLRARAGWYCTLITTSHDYGLFILLAMAPERARLMLQNPMLCCSDVLLLLLSPIITANLPPTPLYSAQILILCFLNAVAWSSQDRAAHNSLSPGRVTAESHLAQVLPLLQYSAHVRRGMPPWVLKFAFHRPSAGLN